MGAEALGRLENTNILPFRQPSQELERTGEYIDSLNLAADIFNVSDYAFRQPQEMVFKTAVRLLEGYEVNPGLIAKDPKRGLLMLAVADEWLSTKKINEKRSLLDVVKAMATGLDENGKYTTQSGVVKRLTERGIPRGTRFNPSWRSNERNGRVSSYDEYLERFTDQRLTDEARRVASQWGEGSELNTVRKTLGITTKTEKPNEIYVVSRNSIQLGQEMSKGGGAFRYEELIFLPSNYKDYNCFDHEYAHTQGDGFYFGLKDILFFQLYEAMTESVIEIPKTYTAQRKVLSILCDSIPGLRSDMLKSYVGDKDARIQKYSKITNHYGLEGFLAIARLGPELEPDLIEDSVERSIYIHPDKVSGLLVA